MNKVLIVEDDPAIAFALRDGFEYEGWTVVAAEDGAPLELTAREFRLLQYFIEHRGKVVTRDRLLDAVWGYEHYPMSRTVDMHIAKLRQKIEETPETPRWLVTIHGSGYKFLG